MERSIGENWKGAVLSVLAATINTSSTNATLSFSDVFGANETDPTMSDEDYIDAIEAYIFPREYEWVLIILFFVVFVVGLVGNFLVCLAVYRNQTMRTVTNYFIVNLAVADFLVILLCLPPSVLVDVTETWFIGSTLCKVVPYLQTVSVSVSVLTLTFISVDRWYAICHPLKFRSTITRAKKAIAAIWIISLLIDIPDLIILDTRPKTFLQPIETIYLTQCVPMWDQETDLINESVKFALLYALPLLFISATYYKIIRVLWRSARFALPSPPPSQGSGVRDAVQDNQSRVSLMTSVKDGTLSINSNASTEMQLRSRRKAARMLVVVVIVFAVCYFPVHIINILRNWIPINDFSVAAALVSHWLCYFNSAINPVIYNVMSKKFRLAMGCVKHPRRRMLSPCPSLATNQSVRVTPNLFLRRVSRATASHTSGAPVSYSVTTDAIHLNYFTPLSPTAEE